MLDHAYAVILAGGRGERFWPMSVSTKPKQLHAMFGERTLLGMAVDRLAGLIPPERIFVVTNDDIIEATKEAAPELPVKNIIGEPFGRDTAAAVALANALVKARDPEGVFCILTADHIMDDLDLYKQTLKEGLEIAQKDEAIVTIGIKPDTPATGYGYIESGDAITDHSGQINFFKAKRFVEKPDLETAQSYLAAGNFCWNSGMFIWSTKTLDKAFAQHTPALADMMAAVGPTVDTSDFAATLLSEYEKLEKISIDYAIMENADNIIMAEGIFAWDDAGDWPAVGRHFPLDDANNVKVGDVQTLNASNNIVMSNGRLTAIMGVDDLVIVQTDDVTLICPKDQAQNIKQMVTHLREQGSYDQVL